MRVLIWSNFYLPHIGGTEVFVGHLVRHLRKRGHEFSVICSHASTEMGGSEIIDGVCVHHLPLLNVLEARDLSRVARCLERVRAVITTFDPAVIHLHSAGPALFFLERLGRGRRPEVVTLHSDEPFLGGPATLAGRTLCRAKGVAAISKFVGNSVLAALPEISQRLMTIPHALPSPPDSLTPAPVHPLRVLGLGRFIPEKGWDILLRAFVHIRRGMPEAELVLAGDGPSRSLLEKLAGELDLFPLPHFTGWIPPDQVLLHLESAAIVAVPSLWQEPFGLVALQAAQAGRPLVGSAVGGLPEIVSSGLTGLLVPPGQPEALAGALLELLRDPVRSAAMGAAARQRAEHEFRFDRLLDDYERLYLNVISS